MDEIKRLLLDTIEYNNNLIESYRQKDYELMIRSVEELKRKNYDAESLAKVFSFDVIKGKFSNIKDLVNLREGYKKLVELFENDILNIDAAHYNEIITKYHINTSFTPLNLRSFQVMFQNSQITISKQPILDQLKKVKEGIQKDYQECLKAIEINIEDLLHFLEQKRYNYNGRNNVSLELDMVRSKQEKLLNLLETLDQKGLFDNYDQYYEIALLIEACPKAEEVKQKMLIDLFDIHQKSMLQPLNRQIEIVNEQIEENASDLLQSNDIVLENPTLENEEEILEPLTFEDIIPTEVFTNYKFYKLSLDDRKNFEQLKEIIESYIQQNNLTKQDIEEPFIKEYVNMINEIPNGREEYYDDSEINWQIIMADLQKHASNEEEILKICDYAFQAIRNQKVTERIKAVYNFRTKQLLEMQEELQSYNNEIMKLDHSQEREDLIVKVNVLLSQLHELDATDEEKYEELMKQYDEMKGSYKQLLNPVVVETPNNDDENLLIFSPDFIDEIRQYPDINYYREIKTAIDILKSKKRINDIKDNFKRYRRSDKRINGVSEVKINELMVFHVKINDGCYYVFGVTKRMFDKRLKGSYYVTDEEIDRINNWLNTTDASEIRKYCDKQLADIMMELSKWDKDKVV